MSETDTATEVVTDNAPPSTSIDDPANLNFVDPSEDTPEVTEETGTEGETDEAESQEAEPAETTEDDDEAEPIAADAEQPETDSGEATEGEEKSEAEVTVALQDGTKLPLEELKTGYMRQADYTRKTQELSNNAKELTAKAENIERTIDTFANFISQNLPPEPDTALAVTDPAGYVASKAQYDAAIAQIQTLVDMSAEPKQVQNAMSQTEIEATQQRENAALASLFPETSNPDGRKKFIEASFGAGRELGYTDEEMSTVMDHRLLGLAYWAKKGMESEKASSTAKTKVKDVPPVTPVKRKKTVNADSERSRKAMQRLAETGSIEDAMKVDFPV